MSGFTIVELLIVIVVIGILAAITLVAFGGIRDRATTATVASDLNAFYKKVQIFKLDNDRYPLNTTEQNSLQFTATQSAYMTGDDARINLLYCTSSGHTNFALLAMANTGKKYYITNTSNGVQEYTGANSWNINLYPERCATVLGTPSSNTGTAGYSQGDTTSWRLWTRGGSV